MKKVIQTILFIYFNFSIAAQEKVTVIPNPQKIYIEKGEHKNYLNFDFIVKNNTSDTLTITKILVSVLDKNDHVIHQRFLDNNGTAPSIKIISDRRFMPQDQKLIFNPFPEYNICLLYTSPSPRDRTRSRMPSSA